MATALLDQPTRCHGLAQWIATSPQPLMADIRVHLLPINRTGSDDVGTETASDGGATSPTPWIAVRHHLSRRYVVDVPGQRCSRELVLMEPPGASQRQSEG